jgi:hypothetical protein
MRQQLVRGIEASYPGAIMRKSVLLAAIQQEIQRHDFSHFMDESTSIAAGGKGIVVPGCPTCKKRLNTVGQFLADLSNDAMPALIDRLAASNGPQA